jgi:hypothetical protein
VKMSIASEHEKIRRREATAEEIRRLDEKID